MPRRRAAKGQYVCPDCGRTFNMAAHLSRHRQAQHGVSRAAQTAPGAGKRLTGRRGRTPNIAKRFGLRTLSLAELSELIKAAKAEAEHKIAEYRQALQ